MDEKTALDIINQCYRDSFLNCDSYVNEVRERCIYPAFQKLAFSFCITTSELYSSIYDFQYGIRFQSDSAFVRDDEVNKSSKRLHNLISVLLLNPAIPTTNPPEGQQKKSRDFFFNPKVFDCNMEAAMCASFNMVANSFGFPRLNSNLVFRIDEDVENLNGVRETDIHLLPRHAFSFVEYATLCCLYLSIHSKSLQSINKVYTNSKQKHQTKCRFQKISNTLFDPKYHDIIVRTILDRLHDHVAQEENDLMDRHCREFWVSETHRDLKYLNYVMKKHALKDADVPTCSQVDDADVMEYIRTATTKLLGGRAETEDFLSKCSVSRFDEPLCPDDEQTAKMRIRFGEEADAMRLYDSFCSVICSTAELIAFGHLPSDIEITDRYIDIRPYINFDAGPSRITENIERYPSVEILSIEYRAACDLAEFAKTYFFETQKAVAGLLEALPEAVIADGKNFYEYLRDLKST